VVLNYAEGVPAEIEPFRGLVSPFNLLLDVVMTFEKDLLIDWIYEHVLTLLRLLHLEVRMSDK